MNTQVFRFNPALMGRPPLSAAELTPGAICMVDDSVEALELELRQVIARRYALSSSVARTRARLVTASPAFVCAQFNVQNQALEEFSRLDYLETHR